MIAPNTNPGVPGQRLFTETFSIASMPAEDQGPMQDGSVEDLFQTSTFVGPNQSEKTARLKPRVDLVAMAENFNQMRIKLAELPGSPFDPTAPQSHVSLPDQDLTGDPAQAEDGPRMSVAAVDPALASAALDAIDKASPVDPSIPVPVTMPEQLAYARENTPATERVVNAFSARERWCMATAIYFEARGESYRGQVAVAQVVMNRVKTKLYPGTICGVVFQNQTWRNRCQFSFACDGIPERVTEAEPWKQAQEIADQVTAGTLYLPEVANATHYHAAYVYPHWAPRMEKVTRIGEHIFYRFKTT